MRDAVEILACIIFSFDPLHSRVLFLRKLDLDFLKETQEPLLVCPFSFNLLILTETST